MEKELSHEISILCDSVKKFMKKNVAPVIESVDHYPAAGVPDGFFDSLLSHLGSLGLLEVPYLSKPEASDEQVGILTAVTETAAEIYASVPMLILANAFARYLLLEKGTEEQKKRWLEQNSAGSRIPLLGFPLYMEPDGNGLSLEGSREQDGSITLKGSCELVVNAPLADGLMLPLHLDNGLGLVVLPSDIEALELSSPVLTLGLRGCPVADAKGDGIRVPEAMILDLENSTALVEALSLFAGPVAALCSGICRGSLREAAAYTTERRQGGHRLEEYSQMRMMIASMAMRSHVAHSAAEQITRSGGIDTPGALASFLQAREAATLATQDGVQLLGGYGYMEDYGQERRMRDARQAQALLGRDDRRRLQLSDLAYRE